MSATPSRFTPEEAETLLKELSVHFGQPVQPIRRYCAGLFLWRTAIRNRADRLRAKMFPGIDGDSRTEAAAAHDAYLAAKARMPASDAVVELVRFEGFSNEVDYIFMSVSKSSLLARILYGREPMRTEMCPTHQGVWSGIGDCEHGCGKTGWLPQTAAVASDVSE